MFTVTTKRPHRRPMFPFCQIPHPELNRQFLSLKCVNLVHDDDDDECGAGPKTQKCVELCGALYLYPLNQCFFF